MKKLDVQFRERVKAKLALVKENPLLFFEKLHGIELFKLRIGKYRILAQVNFGSKKITLLTIEHRQKVYRKI